ncbi:hypothetical protein HanRHA438_Chr02g0050621 [Helianthus annuus]|nr:hypothetical protein HanHA300_Chr02g0040201 [Helianthus annuus]KAJ0617572.1 hypothetical protein HanHA89_Chr02g0043311 [Helianthus annuus]KAJ0776107.1 hypothetical protein HanLR1_Chr02g0041831 [Helianthus annuus]KAJ0938510.1 hypothetical protein HanRHA438_Chr02g0050621 [Helianthus annuus]
MEVNFVSFFMNVCIVIFKFLHDDLTGNCSYYERVIHGFFFLNNSMVILLFGLRNMGVTSWYQSHGLREIKYVEVNT